MSPYRNAYRALYRVFEEGAYLSDALGELNGADRAKSTFLVYGVLDRAIELDRTIDANCKKPKPEARIILRMGCFLSKYSRMPDYAAVDACVSLCREIGRAGLCGFVNATLKNCIVRELPLPADRAQALSVQYSVPLWIVRKYLRQYGADAEKLLSFRPCTEEHVRVRGDLAAFCEKLDAAGVKYRDSLFADALFVDYAALLGANLPQESFVKMNEGSMRICRLAAEGEDREKISEILDACAAPGGKSCYLSDLFPEARVYACELHAHRTELIRAYVKRLGAKNVVAVQADAEAFRPEFSERFPLVLADVPCSGLGVMYSKPDLKLRRKPEDVPALAEVQERILANLCRYVKKGGVLVYATCTTLREENEDVVFRFLRDHADFFAEKSEKWNPATADCEGFFAAKFRRRL